MSSEIKILFPDNRLNKQDETVLRQAQLVALRILNIVDYICKKHKIEYWLDGGTLLGAVRHKGFIPWDDDIDIAMTREDYEKFIKIAPNELPEDLFMQNLDTTPYAENTWTQIKDRKSKLVLVNKAKHHQGIYIDIFPCDSYSESFVKRVFKEKIYKLSYIRVQAINAPYKKPFLSKTNLPKNFVKFLLKVVFFVFAIFNYEVIYKINLNTREKRIYKMKNNPRNNFGYGTDVLNWDKVYSADTIFPLKSLNFEGYEFSVPSDYEKYLTTLYGNDYMTLPPENKRIYHNQELKVILSKEEEKEINRDFH